MRNTMIRWMIITWLLLSGAMMLYSPHKAGSATKETIDLMHGIHAAFEGVSQDNAKADAYSRLGGAVEELESILDTPRMSTEFIVMRILAVLAALCAVMLILRRPSSVYFSIAILALVLIWGTYATFAKEQYRAQIALQYEVIYDSVSALSGQDVDFSPALKRALRPQLASSLSFRGIDLLMLTILFIKRNTILNRNGIQQDTGGDR